MKTNNATRSNVCRWLLLLLNVFLAVGMFCVVSGFGYDSRQVFGIWVNIPDYEFYYELKDFQAINRVCVTVAIAALILVPVLHTLKLFGVMGEKVRNSVVVSCLFSVLELLGALAVPASYVMTYRAGNTQTNSLTSAFQPITVWTYVLVALTVIALILSILLRSSNPIFENNLENKYKAAHVWYCPKCGSLNVYEALRCNSCKAYRPKGY